jgi:tetratricopeptide (TPR) repeat protein
MTAVLLLAVVTGLAAGAADGAAAAGDAGAGADGGAGALAVPLDRAAARRSHEAALAALKEDRLDDAIALLAQAAAADPQSAVIATDHGFFLGKAGRRDAAEAELRRAIALDPHRFYAYVNLVDVLMDDGRRFERRGEIQQLIERGLELAASDARARFGLLVRQADLERMLGHTRPARRRLEGLLAGEAGAAPLTLPQRKHVLDLLDAVRMDEAARALEDWPAPEIPQAEHAALAGAEEALRAGDAARALALVDPLIKTRPTWREPRSLRAGALERLRRYDEARRELTIVVQLAPSDARAWRRLGLLLAQYGGTLEAARADEALRTALVLEPAFTDLKDVRARLALERGSAPRPPAAGRTDPSARAQTWFREAEDWLATGDADGVGRALLERALDDSPGFVAAAALWFAFNGSVPEKTVRALWDDGAGLWALTREVRRLAKEPQGRALARPWLDRAVELGSEEARYARAVIRVEEGDPGGALADLTAYVASEARPRHLDEARALRAELRQESPSGTKPPPRLLATIRLMEEKPDEALAALGGRCAAGMAAENLVVLGRVYEYVDDLLAAVDCYAGPATVDGKAGEEALARVAGIAARAPAEIARAIPLPLLRRADERHASLGAFGLGRRLRLEGDEAGALAALERFLAEPADDLAYQARARAEQAAILGARASAAQTRANRARAAVGAGALVALAILLLWARARWGGASLARALRRRPGLFPDVSRVLGELRHDVLKHRTSALGLASDPAADLAAVRSALLEPEAASAQVAAAYAGLGRLGRASGVRLCSLAREPVLGPLHADLRRAEAALATAAVDRRTLLRVDEALRGLHADGVASLLKLAPRTRLDAVELSRWVDGLEAAQRRDGHPWVSPALSLSEMTAELPVERGALLAIFSNLLRNAELAVAGQDEPRVEVRLEVERDVTGRQTVSLLVGDSAPAPLSLDLIEARESGRGLGIVRDQTRAWLGQVVLRPAEAPLTKLCGACFPL